MFRLTGQAKETHWHTGASSIKLAEHNNSREIMNNLNEVNQGNIWSVQGKNVLNPFLSIFCFRFRLMP
jgi:hypothetical protein